MNARPSSKKTIISIIVIVVILMLAYFYFSGGSNKTDTGSALVQTQGANSELVGVRVLNLLKQIKSLKIDTSLFKDQAYLNLMDYSVTIPEIPVGRPNPFAPIQ